MKLIGYFLFFICIFLLGIFAPYRQVCADTNRTPVVLIPGMLGSRLCDGDAIIWGGINSLRNFKSLDTFSEAGKKLKPCGILKKIEILGPFWSSDGYDELLKQLVGLGYVENKDLFIFDYDWRKSNFETASQLKEKMKLLPSLQYNKFHILAHSMGGIVARILVQDEEISKKVDRLIYLGTPFQGSTNALGTITEGWGLFANIVAGGIDTIRKVVLSFNSIYELMPRFERCCRFGSSEKPSTISYIPTLLDAELWRKYDWLPQDYRDGERKNFFDQAINAAVLVRDLMNNKRSDLNEIRIVGTGIETKLYLYVDPKHPSWRSWRFSTEKGDGTVPIWSASNGEVLDSSPAFSPHASIFQDQWVSQRLNWLLTNPLPPPIAGPGAMIDTIKHEQKTVDRVSVEAKPLVAKPGDEISVEVRLLLEDRVDKGDIIPTASIDGKQLGPMTETSNDDGQLLNYTIKFSAPADVGAHRIQVEFAPSGRASTYIIVN